MSDQFQESFRTAMFRYPEHFSAAREIARLQGYPEDLGILSFGCSLGDEPVSLLQHFPQARVVGCDSNENVLQIARERLATLPITFIPSTAADISAHGPYHLIFCMSTFCRHPLPSEDDNFDLNAVFPYQSFIETLEALTGTLAEGGAIIIVNSNYPTATVPALKNLHALNVISGESLVVDRFDASGRHLTHAHGAMGCRYNLHRVVNPGVRDRDFFRNIFINGEPRFAKDALLTKPSIPDAFKDMATDYAWNARASSEMLDPALAGSSYLEITQEYRLGKLKNDLRAMLVVTRLHSAEHPGKSHIISVQGRRFKE